MIPMLGRWVIPRIYDVRYKILLVQGASLSVGNAAYHNSDLYQQLLPAIKMLISLLDDPVAKTRANAAGRLPSYCKIWNFHGDKISRLT
jgi:hypothetical protein